MTLKELHNNVKALKTNYKQMLTEVLKMYESEASDINIDQMQLGYTRLDDDYIARLRDSDYADMKKFLGGRAPLGVVDLKNTGAFQENIYSKAIVTNKIGFFNIGSKDRKTKMLEKIFGKEIWGFNSENKDILQEQIIESLIIEIKNRLKL